MVAVDREDRPVVLYHRLQSDGGLPHQAILARPNMEGRWQQLVLNDKLSAVPDTASISTPGGICIDEQGAWHLALTMTPEPSAAENPFGHPHTEVLWARSQDQGQHFESRVISHVDDQEPHWLPSIERSTGFNRVHQPAIIFTAGPKGASLNDRLHNKVYLFLTPADDRP